MDTKALPTTILAVEADLKARSDFRGINEAGQIHYMFGMATAIIAEQNREIDRLNKLLVEISADIAKAQELLETIR